MFIRTYDINGNIIHNMRGTALMQMCQCFYKIGAKGNKRGKNANEKRFSVEKAYKIYRKKFGTQVIAPTTFASYTRPYMDIYKESLCQLIFDKLNNVNGYTYAMGVREAMTIIARLKPELTREHQIKTLALRKKAA